MLYIVKHRYWEQERLWNESFTSTSTPTCTPRLFYQIEIRDDARNQKAKLFFSVTPIIPTDISPIYVKISRFALERCS